MAREPVDPICPTDYDWNPSRKCCEFDGDPALAGCPDQSLLTNFSGKCTNDPWDSAGLSSPYAGLEIWYLVSTAFNDPPPDLEFAPTTRFALIQGNDTTAPVKVDGTYYNHAGGASLSFEVLVTACRMAFSALSGDTNKYGDSSISWNGCHCYDVSAPTVDLGEPDFRNFTILIQLPGEISASNHDYEPPQPYFGLRLIPDPVFLRDCWRENPIWCCPQLFESVLDAGEDQAYQEGSPGTCYGQCNGTGSCPPHYEYDPDLGLCLPLPIGGPCNMHTSVGQYHVADDVSGIRYRRSEDTVPPFTLDVAVTSDEDDHTPRMIQDDGGRIVLVWVRGTDVLESVSDDDGETWSGETTIFTGATQATIAKDRQTGMILRAALIDGEVVLTRQYPGDSDPSAEFAAQLYPGPTALALDDAGFHLSMAPEGPARWLLIGVVSGAAANYASSDDGATWLSVD